MWQKENYWLLAFCFVLALLLLPVICWGQEEAPQSSESSNETIISLLNQSESNLILLSSRLKDRKAEVLSLQADLINLSMGLEQARQLLEKSRQDLSEMKNSLDSLYRKFVELQEYFNQYRIEAGKIIRNHKRELWIWRGATVLASGLLVVSLFN